MAETCDPVVIAKQAYADGRQAAWQDRTPVVPNVDQWELTYSDVNVGGLKISQNQNDYDAGVIRLAINDQTAKLSRNDACKLIGLLSYAVGALDADDDIPQDADAS